jgi:hypothetical protein
VYAPEHSNHNARAAIYGKRIADSSPDVYGFKVSLLAHQRPPLYHNNYQTIPYQNKVSTNTTRNKKEDAQLQRLEP